jgi:hypothetical protein
MEAFSACFSFLSHILSRFEMGLCSVMNFSGYDYDKNHVAGDGEGPNGDGYREEALDDVVDGGGDGGFDEWILSQSR